MSFAEQFNSFKWSATTNKVENLHSVRRKFADKRLHFSKSFIVRADLAIYTTFVPDWLPKLLQRYESVLHFS